MLLVSLWLSSSLAPSNHSLTFERKAQDSSYGTFTPSSSNMAAELDTKAAVDHVSDDATPATGPGHAPSSSKLEAPPLVAAMSHEQRLEAEAKLRRKIDTRLLPMIILMYIMNYLDRNNIAAVRLAGLQDELNLSSTEYQVRLSFSTIYMNHYGD